VTTPFTPDLAPSIALWCDRCGNPFAARTILPVCGHCARGAAIAYGRPLPPLPVSR